MAARVTTLLLGVIELFRDGDARRRAIRLRNPHLVEERDQLGRTSGHIRERRSGRVLQRVERDPQNRLVRLRADQRIASDGHHRRRIRSRSVHARHRDRPAIRRGILPPPMGAEPISRELRARNGAVTLAGTLWLPSEEPAATVLMHPAPGRRAATTTSSSPRSGSTCSRPESPSRPSTSVESAARPAAGRRRLSPSRRRMPSAVSSCSRVRSAAGSGSSDTAREGGSSWRRRRACPRRRS